MPTDKTKNLAQLRSRLDAVLGRDLIKTAAELPKISASPLNSYLSGEKISTASGTVFLHQESLNAEHIHGWTPLADFVRFSPEKFPETLAAASDHTRIVFLDTETTGLSAAAGAHAFLTGVARLDAGGGLNLLQYFVETRANDKPMLEAVADQLSRADCLVTYNGAAFDLPMLEARYREHALASPFADLPHLDLLKTSRRLWKTRCVNCRLTTLEKHIVGYERMGDVPGAEIPGVYRDYLRRGPSRKLADVFFHNALDIITLAALLHHAGRELTLRPHQEAKPSKKTSSALDRKKSFKKLLSEHKKSENWDEFLKTARLMREETRFTDPMPVVEAAKLLEGALGDAQGALEVIEEALERGLWGPKDRESLEKRRDKLVIRLNLAD